MKPPEWLEEWEAEYAFRAHPEQRSDTTPNVCPQCEHTRHYQTCCKRRRGRECGCPAATGGPTL